MKKIIALFICICTILCLVACGSANEKEVDIDSIKTIEDVYKLSKENEAYSISLKYYVSVFSHKGIVYRVVAEINQQIYDDLDKIDFYDDKKDEKYLAILKDCKIVKVENLTAQLPTAEDMKAYEGKTGQDLLDEEFYDEGYDLNGQVFFMRKGIADLYVYFNETVENPDDLSTEELIKDLTVKKIEVHGVSNSAVDYEQ